MLLFSYQTVVLDVLTFLVMLACAVVYTNSSDEWYEHMNTVAVAIDIKIESMRNTFIKILTDSSKKNQ